MPGRRRLWTYSVRPDTFSRASSRGTERPTCLPCIVVVAIGLGSVDRLAHDATDIDAQQLAFVGGGAAHIGDDLDFLGRSVAGTPQNRVGYLRAGENGFGRVEPDGLLGGGAHDEHG